MNENINTDRKKVVYSIAKRVAGGENSPISVEDMATRVEQTGHSTNTLEWINKLLSEGPIKTKK